MGNCTICGQTAGLLKSIHKSCVEKQQKSKKEIQLLFLDTYQDSTQIGLLRKRANSLAREGGLTTKEALQTVVDCLGNLINLALEDKILTENEENAIVQIGKTFEDVIDPVQLGLGNEKIVKAGTIRDLQAGIFKSRISVDGHLPILLEKTEQIIWVFKSTKYYETRMKTQYVGGSHGMSFRVMKGVYYRVGAHKAERIQTKHTELADAGLFVITSKNIHFKGVEKSFRIPIKKLISVDLHSDGITIFKDSANPKPQSFLLDDPWFAANAINALN